MTLRDNRVTVQGPTLGRRCKADLRPRSASRATAKGDRQQVSMLE
jgi:hypothetical protein